ncbi:dihydrofolate reductase-like protein [Pyronema domesticum]|nr:dihydrofolate reductase-like protein [Pyronema domesticum]
MSSKPLTLIVAATTPSLGIGRNGALPWRLKSELAYFARVTKRTQGGPNALIMGRKTWLSIPPRFRPLPDRLNVVLSRDTSLDLGENVITATSFDDALQKLAERDVGRVYVIGGGEIYKTALQHPATENVLLTRIFSPFDCDTFFPALDGWEEAGREKLSEFVGERVEEGNQKEGDVEFKYELWQKKSN